MNNPNINNIRRLLPQLNKRQDEFLSDIKKEHSKLALFLNSQFINTSSFYENMKLKKERIGILQKSIKEFLKYLKTKIINTKLYRNIINNLPKTSIFYLEIKKLITKCESIINNMDMLKIFFEENIKMIFKKFGIPNLYMKTFKLNHELNLNLTSPFLHSMILN